MNKDKKYLITKLVWLEEFKDEVLDDLHTEDACKRIIDMLDHLEDKVNEIMFQDKDFQRFMDLSHLASCIFEIINDIKYNLGVI